MEESKRVYDRPSVEVSLEGAEFARGYGPDVSAWKLTDFGRRRLDDNALPPDLPVRAYGLMKLLRRLEVAEEDELADYMYHDLNDLRALLRRLVGYGYVERTG